MATDQPTREFTDAERADAQKLDPDVLIPVLTTIVQETKAGWKTTEFWVTVVVSLLTLLDVIPLPEKFEAVVVGAAGIAYVLSRGLAKKGTPAAVTESRIAGLPSA